MQEVVTAETHVQGPTRFDATLKAADPAQGYYRDIAVLAFPTPKSDMGDKPYRLDNWKLKAG